METLLHIAHIIRDDKFWKYPIYWFEKLNGCRNRYICIVDDIFSPFLFIKGEDSERVEKVTYSMVKEIFSFSHEDVYMFHPLTTDYYDIVLSLPKNKIVIWSSWGCDIYYSDGLFPSICGLNIYKPLTQRDLRNHCKLNTYNKMKQKIKYLLQFFDRNGEHYRRLYARKISDEVVSRISFFSSVLDSEYDLMKRHRYFNALYFPFKYTYGKTQSQIVSELPCDYKILLGNSADPSNNFADVLEILSQRRINYKLFVPLAYGETWYRDVVVNYIRKFRFSAEIHDNFVPYDEYMSLINQCRVAVFGHIRQQAMGNVCAFLFRGCKVFLYKNSVTYGFLKSKGFYVFSIDDDLTKDNVDELLSDSQRKHNIDLLLRMENPKIILENLQLAVDGIRIKLKM